MPRKTHLEPYMPGRPCPRCQAEGAKPAYHERPVLAVFGGAPQWPCSGLDGRVGIHMCTRCECGYTWMESVGGEEQAMSFIKTASGQVTGTDQRGMERTAALAPGWGPGDEDGLEAENAAADQPGGEGGDGPLPVS